MQGARSLMARRGLHTHRDKLLFLIGSVGVGGAERLVVNLACKLSERNDVSICTLKDIASHYQDILRRHNISSYRLDFSGWLDAGSYARFARLIKKNEFDVVNSHLFECDVFAFIAFGLFFILPKRSFKWVITIHNTLNWFYVRSMKTRLKLQLWRHAVKSSDSAVFVCNTVKNTFIAKYGFKPKRARVIYNFIDEDLLQLPSDVEGKSSRNEEEVVYLNIGALSEQKNQQLLIGSFERLIKKKINARLLIAGEGPRRSELQAQIMTSGLSGRVTLLGIVKDVSRLMSENDVFVLSSKWEGMPMVLLEAMCCGLPIIATDVGGNAELVSHGKNGILVEAGDGEGLERAMLELGANREKRREFGRNSRSIFMEKFISEKSVREYLSEYFEEEG
jgi:glycosyltransferase involved in cell wall biosynthesis